MRKLITILFLCLLPFLVSAQITHYVSSSTGNDANDGLNENSAWQTIDKVNTITPAPGDQILFKRGDTFYGTLTVAASGSAGSPITFGAYGTGANPVITGFTSVSSWTDLGSNIWESTDAVSSLSTCNMVVVNGVNTPMGRYPNTGWRTIGSSTVNSITDNTLDATDWTGGEVVIKMLTYVVNKFTITSQASKTLNFTNSNYTPPVGAGYFIQNDKRTLDTQNEWYYNSSTKKLDVYSTSQPSDIKASTNEVLVDIRLKNYVTFDGLDFEGANNKVFFIGSSDNITIQNCNFNNTGWTAIYGENYAENNYSDNLIIQNCSFNDNPQGIRIDNYFHGALISNNSFKNTGLVYGSWTNEEVQASAIVSKGENTVLEYNAIDSTGYIGILFKGDNVVVRYNYVTNSLMRLDDGGGIYTVGCLPGSPNCTAEIGRKVYNNIVLNNAGTSSGNSGNGVIAYGIYMDDYSNDVEIFNNTVANCADGGIYIHNADSMNIHNNLCYDNDNNGGIVLDGNGTYLRNVKVNANILVAKTSDQRTATYKSSPGNYISLFGTIDSNYYARPIDGYSNIDAVHDFTDYPMSLAEWQAFSGQDVNSFVTPKTIVDLADLRFEYNATDENTDVSLGFKYLDITNTPYNSGSITLQPYSSAVLIKNGALATAPTVSTSGNQTIATNSTTVFSTPVPASGETITGYLWEDVTGSGTAIITSPISQNTGVTNLSVGMHTFRITVTQSDGQTAYAEVSVTVSAAPIANAGSNQTITLPTSSVTLSGSGTVASGQTATYLWTKVSGAGTQTITGNTTLTPTISGFTEGTYVYQLKVTQTDGQFATSTVTITVNPAVIPQSIDVLILRTPHILINSN